MYSTEFKGVAYDVGAKEIVPTGKTRIYDQTTKTWRFPLTVEEEKAYLEEYKKKKAETTARAFIESEYGVCGLDVEGADEKFRVWYAEKATQKGTTRGQVCETIQKEDLVATFIDKIRYLPPATHDYARMEKPALIRAIKGVTGYEEHKRDLASKSDKELAQLLTLLTMKRKDMCGELKKWFKAHDLLIEK
jgi:hypothetical protein